MFLMGSAVTLNIVCADDIMRGLYDLLLRHLLFIHHPFYVFSHCTIFFFLLCCKLPVNHIMSTNPTNYCLVNNI